MSFFLVLLTTIYVVPTPTGHQLPIFTWVSDTHVKIGSWCSELVLPIPIFLQRSER